MRKEDNLISLLEGYFKSGGQHINVNVIDEKTLREAQQKPQNYPQLTIRVSGYAVFFNNLSKELQDEVIKRTFHSKI